MGAVDQALGDDFALGRQIALRMDRASGGILRKLILLGSRATGTARPDSDMDMVAVVEPAERDLPWTGARLREMRRVLVEGSGPHPVKIDLWVRTTDQFAEGCEVVGGFEHLAATEGTVLFSKAPLREPRPRRTPGDVKWANVASWLRDAEVSLRKAASLTFGDGGVGSTDMTRHYAYRTVQRALTALLVEAQLPSTKHESLDVYLEKVAQMDPGLSRWFRAAVSRGATHVGVADHVLRGALGYLCRDPAGHRHLAGVARSMQRPVVYLEGSLGQGME